MNIRFTDIEDLTFPTVHSNGTSRSDLFEGYLEALRKVRDLTEAVQKIEFNARDYYVQGPTAFQTAQDERRQIMFFIGHINKYLEAHAEYLSQQ
jgi:hypothetical protein